MLKKGNQNRTQHPTDANAESSRSHAVFTVYVKQKDCSDQTMPRMAKLSLIDLAGSERATVISANKGIRMREGANINKSLLALGNCINALADRKVNAASKVPSVLFLIFNRSYSFRRSSRIFLTGIAN